MPWWTAARPISFSTAGERLGHRDALDLTTTMTRGRSRWAGDNEISATRLLPVLLLLLLLQLLVRYRWRHSTSSLAHCSSIITAYRPPRDQRWNASSRHGSRSDARAAKTRMRRSEMRPSTLTTTRCPISGQFRSFVHALVDLLFVALLDRAHDLLVHNQRLTNTNIVKLIKI